MPTLTREEASRGTFCVVIGEQLAVSACPLPKGSCMWKHRLHGLCMYSEEFSSSGFTPNDYAKRVGLPPIDPPMVNMLKRTVLANLKKEIAD
jgi:hypothetical protein